MSEEEILEIMKNLLLMPTDWIIKSSYKGNLEHIGALQGNEAIDGLLDLYNKEREKNEEYLEYQCKKCSNNKICKQNNWCVTMDRIPFICDNFQNINSVSKDKIKEKIEELEKRLKNDNIQNINQTGYNYYLGQKEVLEELLKGE